VISGVTSSSVRARGGSRSYDAEEVPAVARRERLAGLSRLAAAARPAANGAGRSLERDFPLVAAHSA
jgi:uridine phosphorylase